MAFRLFGKGRQDGAKSLAKAHKLVTRALWAEALALYTEAAAHPDQKVEAEQGARACREQLVAWNLEEAEAFSRAQDPGRCREHLELAEQLAGDEEDLLAKTRDAAQRLSPSGPSREGSAEPQRLFEPSCSSAACAGCDDPEQEEHVPGEELFEFYLDSLTEAERRVMEQQDVTFQRGFVALQQGDVDTARPLLETAAATSPELPGAAYALGLLEAVAGDAEAALKQFETALAIDPELGPAVHHRADLLSELERFAEAEELLAPWTAAHPDDMEAWFLLARCRDRAGSPEAALETLTTAEEHASGFQTRLALARGQLLRRLGDGGGALTAYQEVVARNPNLIEALVPLGQLLIERGGADSERAAELFKHCRRIDSERGWWHLLQVAVAYHSRGWEEQAREVLETARQELPPEPAPHVEWEAVWAKVAAPK